MGNKTDEFLNKREMTGELSRTGGRVGIWSGAAKTIQGPLLWHFCRLTGLRGRGHYGTVEGRGGVAGKVFAVPFPVPAAAPRSPRTRHPSSICT